MGKPGVAFNLKANLPCTTRNSPNLSVSKYHLISVFTASSQYFVIYARHPSIPYGLFLTLPAPPSPPHHFLSHSCILLTTSQYPLMLSTTSNQLTFLIIRLVPRRAGDRGYCQIRRDDADRGPVGNRSFGDRNSSSISFLFFLAKDERYYQSYNSRRTQTGLSFIL